MTEKHEARIGAGLNHDRHPTGFTVRHGRVASAACGATVSTCLRQAHCRSVFAARRRAGGKRCTRLPRAAVRCSGAWAASGGRRAPDALQRLGAIPGVERSGGVERCAQRVAELPQKSGTEGVALWRSGPRRAAGDCRSIGARKEGRTVAGARGKASTLFMRRLSGPRASMRSPSGAAMSRSASDGSGAVQARERLSAERTEPPEAERAERDEGSGAGVRFQAERRERKAERATGANGSVPGRFRLPASPGDWRSMAARKQGGQQARREQQGKRGPHAAAVRRRGAMRSPSEARKALSATRFRARAISERHGFRSCVGWRGLSPRAVTAGRRHARSARRGGAAAPVASIFTVVVRLSFAPTSGEGRARQAAASGAQAEQRQLAVRRPVGGWAMQVKRASTPGPPRSMKSESRNGPHGYAAF